MDEIFSTYDVHMAYCDPQDWRSEIGDWALLYGMDHVAEWATNRISQMHEALKRFMTDLTTKAITHDGCPITAVHIANARKVAKPGQRYILGKPTEHQKIDAAMASVLAHEAAAVARGSGWSGDPKDTRVVVFR